MENVLGLQWYCPEDELGCRALSLVGPPTQWTILSNLQRVFDPLGFAAPVLLGPKILLQKSWMAKIGWDDELPSDIQATISKWLEQRHLLNECRFPRRIFLNDNSSMHVFCDASKVAFASCIFLRTEEGGEVKLSLVLAKSRVAPLKEITLPRRDLMAALLRVRLYQLALKCLTQTVTKVYFWMDSSVVVA